MLTYFCFYHSVKTARRILEIHIISCDSVMLFLLHAATVSDNNSIKYRAPKSFQMTFKGRIRSLNSVRQLETHRSCSRKPSKHRVRIFGSFHNILYPPIHGQVPFIEQQLVSALCLDIKLQSDTHSPFVEYKDLDQAVDNVHPHPGLHCQIWKCFSRKINLKIAKFYLLLWLEILILFSLTG